MTGAPDETPVTSPWPKDRNTDMLRLANPDLRPGLGPDGAGRLIVTILNDLLPEASGANIPLFSNR